MVSVAYLTYAERKVLAAIQLRKGPNVVGPFGLWQPFADAVKMLMKETIVPTGSNSLLFLMAPMLTFTLAMLAWAVIPLDVGWAVADINVGILYLFAISSLGVYGVIIAGWASNSKYAFLGALRSAAQMVSYEVSMGLVIVTVLLCVGSLNLTDIVLAQRHVWFCLPLFPMFVIFFISILAECNRSPFDLPEGESEIVAGFFVEYSSMSFGLFFLGEYANMILMSALTSILFLGARPDLVHPEDLLRAVRLPVGPRDLSPLSLRSVDAPWLEGVPAILPALAGADRRFPARLRSAARCGVMEGTNA
jgi:NADH-quinone oxidoreductase subunit H